MTPRVLAVATLLAAATAAGAQCPPSCPSPGGGSPALDCHAEFAGAWLYANHPTFDPAKPKTPREVRCFDGDAGCDLDGATNGACVVDVDVCLHNADPALPECTPSDVTDVRVSGVSDPQLAALQAALTALLPATTNVCTSGRSFALPLRGPDARGALKPSKKKVTVRATTALGRDTDRLRYVCMPRQWPSHGANHYNHRSTPHETTLSPANAAALTLKWQLPLMEPGGNAVTATPTVGNGLVYVASWNGNVYGVKPSDGTVKWTYDSQATFIGVQSSPTLTADGRLVFGDSSGVAHCILAKSGKRLWTQVLGGPRDHFWSSAQVLGNRVYLGLASHTDSPCAPGRLLALDLDTGALVWEHRTVPLNVCRTDTAVECTTDADCGGTPGTCVEGCGGGVTATAAIDPSGGAVYLATVGSFTFPSIGDSETITALDPATGAVVWKNRLTPPEQFPDGPPYHDWGFVNGPMVVDGDDGLGGTRRIVVSAGKEGTVYALDPSDGSVVWSRPLLTPLPDFVGFGLFNGAIGFADHRIFAALDGEGIWPDANDHLFAFDDLDGSTAWSAQIGRSWGHVSIANGLVFAGNNLDGRFFVHDASDGSLLNTLTLPDVSSSGPSIVGGTVYVGYGIFGATGGVMAFGLP